MLYVSESKHSTRNNYTTLPLKVNPTPPEMSMYSNYELEPSKEHRITLSASNGYAHPVSPHVSTNIEVTQHPLTFPHLTEHRTESVVTNGDNRNSPPVKHFIDRSGCMTDGIYTYADVEKMTSLCTTSPTSPLAEEVQYIDVNSSTTDDIYSEANDAIIYENNASGKDSADLRTKPSYDLRLKTSKLLYTNPKGLTSGQRDTSVNIAAPPRRDDRYFDDSTYSYAELGNVTSLCRDSTPSEGTYIGVAKEYDDSPCVYSDRLAQVSADEGVTSPIREETDYIELGDTTATDSCTYIDLTSTDSCTYVDLNSSLVGNSQKL